MIIGPVSNVKGCIAVNMGQPGCPRPLPVRAPGGPITGWGRGNRVAPGPCLWGRPAPSPSVGGGATGLPQAPACGGAGRPRHRLGEGQAGCPRPLPVRAASPSVVHAAAPHNTRMKIFVLGRAEPSQTLPSGRGLGKPGFPMSQPLLGAAGTPHRQGYGETRFPRMFTSEGITRPSRSEHARITAPVLARLLGWRASLEESDTPFAFVYSLPIRWPMLTHFASHSLAHVDPFRFSFVGPC